jgi:hypothetical protein
LAKEARALIKPKLAKLPNLFKQHLISKRALLTANMNFPGLLQQDNMLFKALKGVLRI